MVGKSNRRQTGATAEAKTQDMEKTANVKYTTSL